MLRIVCLALATLAVTVQVQAGPVSEYYITAGDQRRNHVLQGNSIVRSWNQASNNREYALAVRDGTVRTIGGANLETGSEYTTAGVWTGTTYAFPGTGSSSYWDGTTDGTYNYAWDYSLARAVRFDLDWSNQQTLFTFGGGGQRLGITYDSSNDSLWISGWGSGVIENWTLSGTLLSSFATPAAFVRGLALDSADDTLWLGGSNRTLLYQYSKSGTLLSTETYAGLADQNWLGGEFELVSDDPIVPEPTSLALLGLGGVGLLGGMVRRRIKARTA